MKHHYYKALPFPENKPDTKYATAVLVNSKGEESIEVVEFPVGVQSIVHKDWTVTHFLVKITEELYTMNEVESLLKQMK